MSPTIQLVQFLRLSDFPSGSSINYYDEKLYLIGDDASNLLILTKHYEKADEIVLFNRSGVRIPKAEKVDLEASLVLHLDKQDYLLAMGSASRDIRQRLMLIALKHTDPTAQRVKIYDTSIFVKRLLLSGMGEINIEGATLIGESLILANRGHAANTNNHFILTETCFWKNQEEAGISIASLVLPLQAEGFIGVSELFYVESADVLLITLSSEATANSYDDGAIGHSYLGWIRNARDKVKHAIVALDGLINLSDVSEEFRGEKIEGICAESVMGTHYVLHLVSDNDQGETKLFKINLNF